MTCRSPEKADFPRMLRLFAAALLSASLGACAQKEVDESTGAAASDPVERSVDSDTVDSATKKDTAGQWSDSVKGRLAQIAAALAHDEVPTALSEQVKMVALESFEEKEMFSDGAVRMVEVIASAQSDEVAGRGTISAKDFISQFRERLFLTADPARSKAYFKLYGITEVEGRLKTKQRLTARGVRAGNTIDSYAVVEATWDLPETVDDSEEQLPVLVELSMSKLVQNELTKTTAVFEDVAATVLGGNESWNEQLRPGMNTWVRHIETTLNPDFLGYHGVAVADVNGDSLEDLYLCQPGGLPNLLFQQQPDGTLVDVSKGAGVDWLDNSTAALLVDLDNDGDVDLAVATRAAFLIMENDGAGKFSLRQELTGIAAGYSPTASDYDLDGDLDLLVLRYAGASAEIGDFPTPHPFHSARNGGANVLLQNRGGFTFADVTDETGLGVENFRFSFAAAWEDFDNDGDSDLYIANDFGPNQLFRNEGSRFVDATGDSGSQDWGFGMSVSWADYDRDGFMDLYVSSMFSGAGNQVVPQADFNPSMSEETRGKYLKMVRGNSLMRNTAGSGFSDITDPMVEGFAGWAWGAAFADFNNDGWEDLYVANGYVSQPDKDDL